MKVVERDSRPLKFQTQQEFWEEWIFMNSTSWKRLDQWDFKHDKLFEIVEHNMIWIQRGTWRKFEGVEERR